MAKYGKLVKLENQLYLLINWKDLQTMISELGEKILENYQPNLIVGVVRGGIIVANLLSDYLFGEKRNFEILAVRCRTWSNVEEGRIPSEKDFLLVQDIPFKNLQSYNVLGVDDVLDTGTTWKELKKAIEDKQPKNLKIASLHLKDWSKIEPDFYVEKISHKVWVFYPWEVREVSENAIKKLIKNGYSFEDAKREIRKSFDYVYQELESKTLEKIFQEIEKSVSSN